MNPKHIRAFYIGRQRFHVTDRGDGTLQVSSIHPYDETDYHWAYQASKSCWHICREGRKVSVLASMDSSEIAPETVAQFLLKADSDAQLKPRRAIWRALKSRRNTHERHASYRRNHGAYR